MAKRFKTCILHIGTEKTGTTTIQNFLATNRRLLAQEGLLYTVAAGNDGSQRAFEAFVHDEPWLLDLSSQLGIADKQACAQYQSRFLARLEQEFAAHPNCRTLVISSEHLHSRVTGKEAIARLKVALQQWVEDFEVVLYLRRQDRVAVSFYSTRLKSGEVRPVVFPGTREGVLHYYYDYESIYDNWADSFGAAAMRVRLFGESEFFGGDLLRDFCHVCGIDYAGKRLPANANESLSQAGVDFLLELNRQMPRMLDRHVNPLHERIVSAVAACRVGRNQPGVRADAEAFYGLYRAGNQRLKARVFPDRAAPLFDEDFSDYPEQPCAADRRYEDAVALAIELVRADRAPLSEQARADEIDSLYREVRRARAENFFLQAKLATPTGKIAFAIDRLRKAVEVEPAYGKAHLMLARLLLSEGERARGEEHLRCAQELMSDRHPEVQRLSAQYANPGEKTRDGVATGADAQQARKRAKAGKRKSRRDGTERRSVGRRRSLVADE